MLYINMFIYYVLYLTLDNTIEIYILKLLIILKYCDWSIYFYDIIIFLIKVISILNNMILLNFIFYKYHILIVFITDTKILNILFNITSKF